MKRFLYSIILFLIPIIACISIVEFELRQIPNDYSYKKSWMDENRSNVEILAIGASHLYYGFAPQYIPFKSFNLAQGSQSLKYDAFLLDQYIDNAESLKVVFIEISYQSLCFDMESSEEWWRVKKYCVYYDCPYHKWEHKYRTELGGLRLSPQLKRLYDWKVKHVDELYCDSLGMKIEALDNKMTRADLDGHGAYRAKKHTYNLESRKDLITENKAYLKHMVEQCEKYDINVILLSTPVWDTFYDNMDVKQYSMLTQFCDSLVTVYDNVLFLNMMKDDRFSDADFYDADHLSESGAEKLSSILSKKMLLNE